MLLQLLETYPIRWDRCVECSALNVYLKIFVGILHGSGSTWGQDTGKAPPEWPSQEEPGSGLTTFTPVSDVSAPACTNGVWPPLRLVGVAQKNKPSTMSSSNIQSIDLSTAWRFWRMRRPNDCSTPAPKPSAAKQWIKELAQTKEELGVSVHPLGVHECVLQTVFPLRKFTLRKYIF